MPGCERLVAYERKVSTLLTDGRLTGLALVCQFDQRRFPHQALRKLREAHPIVLTAQEAQRREPLLCIAPLEGQDGLRLTGEIDLSNFLEFSTALKSMFRPDRDFHLDLANLSYMDVTAVGLLVKTAATLADGRRFVLRSAAPTIRTTLRVFGWDEIPSLHLVEGRDS
jgi:anti-anti-sigma factor